MDRIVDIATDGRHLSAYRGFLKVEERGQEVGRIPLDDIGAVLVHAHGIPAHVDHGHVRSAR